MGSFTETFLDGTKLSGDWVYDQVCISSNPSSCGKDFKWIAVSNNSGLSSEEDGIIGMWSGLSNPSKNYEGLLTPWLHEKGVIKEPTFSFLMSGP